MSSPRIERRLAVIALIATVGLTACMPPPSYDLILRGGTAPYVGDVAIDGDTIVALGNIGKATADVEIDVASLAVAPGFVIMVD